MIDSPEILSGNVRNASSLSGDIQNVANLDGTIQSVGNINGKMNNGKGGNGTSDYDNLYNKPKINGIELEGDKSLENLGIKQVYTASDIKFDDGTTFQDKYNSGELKGATGQQGEKGETGATGPKGDKGDKGDQGIQGPKGDTGPQGPSGTNGTNGKNGVDGKTPVKGVDYYTEADKQEMVGLVLASLPSSEGVSY